MQGLVLSADATPEAGSAPSGLGGFQETNQLPLFSAITRYQAHVSRPDRIAELTHRAFTIAMAERGPVQVNIPRDHFFGEFDATIAPSHRVERGAGGAKSLDRAADLLAEAKFPVLLFGGGVIMGQGSKQARDLAEFLEVPVL